MEKALGAQSAGANVFGRRRRRSPRVAPLAAHERGARANSLQGACIEIRLIAAHTDFQGVRSDLSVRQDSERCRRGHLRTRVPPFVRIDKFLHDRFCQQFAAAVDLAYHAVAIRLDSLRVLSLLNALNAIRARAPRIGLRSEAGATSGAGVACQFSSAAFVACSSGRGCGGATINFGLSVWPGFASPFVFCSARSSLWLSATAPCVSTTSGSASSGVGTRA